MVANRLDLESKMIVSSLGSSFWGFEMVLTSSKVRKMFWCNYGQYYIDHGYWLIPARVRED